MKRTISLANLNLFLVMLSLVLFIGLLSVFLYFGLEATQQSWYQEQLTALQTDVHDRLVKLVETDGTVTEQALPAVMEGLDPGMTYLVVADQNQKVVYSYRSQGRARGMMFGGGMQDNLNWVPVQNASGTTIAYYALHLPSFSEIEANALLLAAAKRVLVIALLIALVIAFVIAFLFFLPMKRRSEQLSEALNKMAEGERNISLNESRVTEFATIAKASNVLQHNLDKEEKLRRQWAADVAHDLRSPVAVLKGQLEAVADKVLPLDDKRIELLHNETEKLANLINSLALLTHLESPGYKVNTEMISVDKEIQTLLARFEAEASKRNITLQYDQKEAMVFADSQLFTRALDNLLSNAIRYAVAPSEIKISITTDTNQQAQTLVIENEGSIDPEFLPRIFDRLSRAESSRTTEGSGLGLAIVGAIATAHGWDVKVESDTKTRSIIHFT